MSNKDTTILELAVKLRAATLRAKLARNGIIDTEEMRDFGKEVFSNHNETALIKEDMRIKSPMAMFLYGGTSTLMWRSIYIGVQLDFLGNINNRFQQTNDVDIFCTSEPF
jgi:hypothetical protein